MSSVHSYSILEIITTITGSKENFVMKERFPKEIKYKEVTKEIRTKKVAYLLNSIG